MKKLKDLDFWSMMILVGLLATIGCGIWNFMLRKERDEVQAAWQKATRKNGEVATIIARLREIRALETSGKTIEAIDPSVYLQTQMSNGGIPLDQFKITQRDRPHSVRVKNQGTKKVVDEEVDLNFKAMQSAREPRFYSRKVIFYGVFNAEAQSPMWKLRDLKLVAKEQKGRKRQGQSSLQAPLSDEWFIEKMTFVSRRYDNK